MADAQARPAGLPDDETIVTTFQACYRDARAHTSDWRTEARELFDVVAGWQWPAEDEAKLHEQQRPHVTFNVVGKFIDALIGLQINNRQEVRFYPREPGDTQVNELLTGGAKWARDECDAEDEETDAFNDLLICGMGWTETDVNFEEDAEGQIRIERRDPLLMYWDPSSRRKNLGDARWIARIKLCSEAEFRETWPDQADFVTNVALPGSMPEDEDVPLHDADNAWKYQRDVAEAGQKRSIPVADYQWYQLGAGFRVKSRYGTKTFTPAQWKKLETPLRQRDPEVEAEAVKVRRYYRAYICGTTVLEAHESPYQEGFTYSAMTGKRDRNKGTWYGVGRGIKDPQQWLNVFFSQLLYTISTNAKGGLLAEEGAFADPQKAESEWARPDSITYVVDGALQAGRVIPKPSSPYPAGLDKLMTFSLQMVPETAGLNQEMLGFADRVQPGVLEAQRKQAALTIIAWAFDAMRRYYKTHGRVIAYYIREYLADGRLVRITGKSGNLQYVPLLLQPETYRYDVVVDDAPTSVNLKERVWLVLQDMLPLLVKMGVMPPPEILDYSPLPADLAAAWKKAITQPSPQKVAQQQLAMRGQVAEVTKTESEAQLNQAKTLDTRAKSVKTAAEAGQAMAGGGGNGSKP